MIPVGRLIRLVRNLLWFLVWLTVINWIDPISVINGQISSLRLRQLTVLILINLDLLFDAFENVGIHLSRRHEAAHPHLELELLQLLRWNIFVLLLDLVLNITWQLLHILEYLTLA